MASITGKLYKCSCCGNVQEERTNHTGEIFVYCKNCSWKAFYMGEKNSISTPQHRHSRKFECIDCEVCEDANGCDQVKYDCPKLTREQIKSIYPFA